VNNWDDHRLFLCVARAQGLAAAVGESGLSAPSLSRRLRNFEETVGQQLFIRQRDGYQLTLAGQELVALLEPIEQTFQNIDQWKTSQDNQALVKVACGGWTAMHLAARIPAELLEKHKVTLSIASGIAAVDLSRREAHLAIRNKRPDHPSLIAQRLGQVEFAIYGSEAYVQGKPEAWTDRRFADCAWIVMDAASTPGPSTLWLSRQLRCAPRIVTTDAQALNAAVRAGLGLCILPSFIGDTTGELVKLSDPVSGLTHSQWLIRHKDDLHISAIQKVAKAIQSL